MEPYTNRFQVGDSVRIKTREMLEAFQEEWQYHHPLEAEQLEHADEITVVSTVGFYHGGDVIYTLETAPGVWHEVCLTPSGSD